jgi:hypothetical protein
MTWHQQYDRNYQVRNSTGRMCFIKTDTEEIAFDVASMGRRRCVWVWSNFTAQYQLQEKPCSENQVSKP